MPVSAQLKISPHTQFSWIASVDINRMFFHRGHVGEACVNRLLKSNDGVWVTPAQVPREDHRGEYGEHRAGSSSHKPREMFCHRLITVNTCEYLRSGTAA